jgi:hypothetical protein
MAKAFNLTAQLNLQGPANLKPVIAKIRRELGSVSADIKVNVDARSAKSIDNITSRLQTMNSVLVTSKKHVTDLNASFRSLSASLSTLSQSTGNTSNQINNISQSSRTTAANIKASADAVEDFGKKAALAAKRFAAFTIATTGIYALINAVRDGLKAFIQFDQQIIRLQQVTGKSAISISSLSRTITELATTLGVSSEKLATVSVTLAQAGLSAEDTRIALTALAKTELAPSFDNIIDTTEGAIAALRQFNLETSELESALGSINAVAAAFAVESSDIIAAIQRTGGVFAAASKGVSEGTDALNEFIAVFTSVRATTRESAETIATGLRTIFTRFQRKGTIDLLQEFGVVLTDLEGKFVGPFEAIKRISAALNELDPRDIRFAQIVEELGGFRQIGKVIPLIQQFATAQQALAVAQQGQASLSDAQVIAQQALANQIAKVREQFLALIRDIGGGAFFQGLFKTVLSLTSGLISLASAFKPILPILGILGAVKGVSAIGKFASGFFGGLGNAGGAGGTGKGIAETITGTREKATADATTKAADAIIDNTAALNSNTTALSALTSLLDTGFKNVISAINSLDQTIKARSDPGATGLNNGGKVLGFARGGIVPGSGNRDTVPAMLQPGEFVIRKKAVESIGTDNLRKFNKYADGGRILEEDTIGAAILKGSRTITENISAADIIKNTKDPNFQDKVKANIPETKSYDVVKNPLDGKTLYEPFNEAINEGLVAATNKSVAKIAKSLQDKGLLSVNTQGIRISRSTQENFLKGLNDASRGNLFENILTNIVEGGIYDSNADPQRPFDFTNGLGSVVSLFPDLDGINFVDAKATRTAANNSNLAGKIAQTIYRDNELPGSTFAQRSGSEINIEGLKQKVLEILSKSSYRLTIADIKPKLSKNFRASAIDEALEELESSKLITISGSPGDDQIKRKVQKLARGGYSRSTYKLVPQEQGILSSPFDVSQSKTDYYSLLDKYSEIPMQEFDPMVSFAKTNDLNLQEFETYLQKRIQYRQQQANIKPNISNLINQLKTPERFAQGGSAQDTVPALLTPGEFVINKKAASKIGSAKLNQLNNADKIQGYNKGGSVGFIKRFNIGGPVDPLVESTKRAAEAMELFAQRAKAAGISTSKYQKELASEIVKLSKDLQSKFEASKGDVRSSIISKGGSLKGASADELDKVRKEFIEKLSKIAPDAADTVKQASEDIVKGLSEGFSFDTIAKNSKDLTDILKIQFTETEATNQAIQEMAVKAGFAADKFEEIVGVKNIEREQFIQSDEGQRFGKLSKLAPDLTKAISKTKIGGVLGKGADFISGKGGGASKLFAAAGGITGIGAGIATLSETIKSFVPQETLSNPNVAGAFGAVSGAGVGAAAGAQLGSFAGPIGSLIGGVGGAIIGGIQGFFNAKNQAILTNAIENVAKATGNLEQSFKKLDQEFNRANFGEAQKAFGDVLVASKDINKFAFETSQFTLSDAGSVGGSAVVGGLTGAGIGALAGSVVPIVGTAVGAALGGIVGTIGGAAYSYFNRPSEAQRSEALSASIQQSGANQQTAQRLAGAQLDLTSTEDIEKVLQTLNAGVSDLTPTTQQYVKSMIDAESKTRVLTNADKEKITQDAIATAQIEAFIQKRKQAGATDKQIEKELKSNKDNAKKEGAEVIRQNDILASKQKLLARALKEVNTQTEVLLDGFRRIGALLTRFSDEVDISISRIEGSIGILTGSPELQKVDRTFEKILGNISAYSVDEIRGAAQVTTGMMGGGEATQFTDLALAAKVFKDQLPALLRQTEGRDINEVINVLTDQIGDITGQNSAAIKEVLNQARGRLETDVAQRQGSSLEDLAGPEITSKLSETLQVALEAAANIQKTYNDTLDKTIGLQNQYNKLILQSRDYFRKANSIRLNAEIEFAKTLGKTLSLEQLNAPFTAEIKSLTRDLIKGGSTDPQEIGAAISRGEKRNLQLEEQRRQAQARLSDIGARAGAEGVDQDAIRNEAANVTTQLQQLNAAIANNNVSLEEGRQALERLANDGSAAANALAKIQEEQRQVEGFGNFIEKLATADPEELFKLGKQDAALEAALSGQAGNLFKSRSFRQDAFAGLEQLRDILTPEEFKEQRASLTEQTLRAQGFKEGDIIQKGGKQFEFSDFIKRLREGGPGAEDPNVIALNAALETQARANEELGRLIKSAADVVDTKINEVFNKLKDEFPTIVKTAFENARTDAAAILAENAGGVADGGARAGFVPPAGGVAGAPDGNAAAVAGAAAGARGQQMVQIGPNRWAPIGQPRPRQNNPQPPQPPQAQPNAWATGGVLPINQMAGQQQGNAWATGGIPTNPVTQDLKNSVAAQTNAAPKITNLSATRRSKRSRNVNFTAAGYAYGGMVPGNTIGDKNLALLESGEFVVNKKAVQKFGVQNLETINKYRNGGRVGGSSGPVPSSPVNANTQSNQNAQSLLDGMNTIFNAFGQYVDKLANIKLPEKIEMVGNHTVDVRVTGAAAFEALEEGIKNLINSEIDTRMSAIWNQSGGNLGMRPGAPAPKR